jgi:AraC family transcriptional regulator
MEPRIEALPEKKLVGKRIKMSFADNKTRELWQSFMPLARSAMANAAGVKFYSVEIYEPHFFLDSFDAQKEFEKWAAIEAGNFEAVPENFEMLTIPEGLYAVFLHQGTASDGVKTYQYIFETWLPASGFSLDERPHFALMGEKYKTDALDSEEEIWIPVKV